VNCTGLPGAKSAIYECLDHFTNTLYILWIALGIFGVTHRTRGVKNI